MRVFSFPRVARRLVGTRTQQLAAYVLDLSSQGGLCGQPGKTGNPFQIKAIALTEGSLMQEKALHSSLRVAFGRMHISAPPNEWYPGRVNFMREFIEHLKFGPNVALEYSERYNPSIRQPGKKEYDCIAEFVWPMLPEAERQEQRKRRKR